ncbi:hypothetical protein [Sphingomonas sp. Root710]|uniref:hypothetical protein n=1 Tax=Sphingomonas sp. Root710 TaxID=1736594 RepID=UPI000AF72408|nr:hypothetical protein [Sphingomonas sp. Root710]
MVYGVLMWIVTVYAFRRGGWTERAAAAAMVVDSYVSVLVVSSPERMFRQVEVNMALTDFGLFVLLWCIGLWSNRFWPLWLAAIQGVTVLAHAAPLIPNMLPYTTHRAVALWSWPQWFILAFAIHRHQRRPSIASDHR